MFFRKRKARREPALGTFGTLFAFGRNARDRIGASGNGATRVAPAARSENKKPRGKKPRRGKLRQLLYWSFVLALWAGLGLIGYVGYQASRLPPLARVASRRVSTPEFISRSQTPSPDPHNARRRRPSRSCSSRA